jgi:redox-sensitive bicupin YhaK (pirin superfamily)
VDEKRAVRKVFSSRLTLEGAGVRLKRAFGFGEAPQLDPFLLLDDFHSDNPADYLAGFPWHPHRGIETITYMLHGRVEHGDSLGNSGVIGPGDVQWMTAGSGIIHQEMPRDGAPDTGLAAGRGESTLLWGFQLWANLPAAHKMMDPRYQEVRSSQIPQAQLSGGAIARVICGTVAGVTGPVQDIMTEPEYLDISVPAGSRLEYPVRRGRTVFAYVIEGSAEFGERAAAKVGKENAVLFDDGDQVVIATGQEPSRFLLVSGRPLGEPVAWRGPIVMNTEEELLRAFQEYRDGTFVKRGSVPPSLS